MQFAFAAAATTTSASQNSKQQQHQQQIQTVCALKSQLLQKKKNVNAHGFLFRTKFVADFQN